jgi:haloacetate dehalogenase
LWGSDGVVGGGSDDPLEVWQRYAADPGLIRGHAVAGAGHFLVEDRPEETMAAVTAFLIDEAEVPAD